MSNSSGPRRDFVTGAVVLVGRLVPTTAPFAIGGSLAALLPSTITLGPLRTDTVLSARRGVLRVIQPVL